MADLFSSQAKSLSSNKVNAEKINRKAAEHFSSSDHWLGKAPIFVSDKKVHY